MEEKRNFSEQKFGTPHKSKKKTFESPPLFWRVYFKTIVCHKVTYYLYLAVTTALLCMETLDTMEVLACENALW